MYWCYSLIKFRLILTSSLLICHCVWGVKPSFTTFFPPNAAVTLNALVFGFEFKLYQLAAGQQNSVFVYICFCLILSSLLQLRHLSCCLLSRSEGAVARSGFLLRTWLHEGESALFRCDTCSLGVRLLSGKMSDTRSGRVARPYIFLFFHNVFHPFAGCNKFRVTGEEQKSGQGRAGREETKGGRC